MPPPPNMRSIPLSKIPLRSSREVIITLERLGAYPGEVRSGSHASYFRDAEDSRLLSSVVILGRREMARQTLQGILYNLEIPLEEFLKASSRGRKTVVKTATAESEDSSDGPTR